jgi:signal transduction histidine kinase
MELDRLRPGRGLRNVAERLEAVGGALEISSAPGQGTAMTGMVPIARADGPPPGAGVAFPGG